MITIPNLDEEKIVDVLETASAKESYPFSLEELGGVLRYTIRKATGRYAEDVDLFAALLENELHDYVTRKRLNEMKVRNAKRCASFV